MSVTIIYFVLCLFVLISESFCLESISLKGCKETKACFKSSLGCTVDNCGFIITWAPKEINNMQYLEIELVGRVENQGGYLAVGFSADKKYGNDGVVSCYSVYNQPQKVEFLAGYNSATDPVSFMSIPTSKQDKDFLVTSDSKNRYGGIFNSQTNRLNCRLLRLISPEKQAELLKDLKEGYKFHLMVMKGKFSPIGPSQPTPGSQVFTDEQIDFSRSAFPSISGSSNYNSPMAKVHGIIMIFAWIICCGIAVMLARYFKDMWVPPLALKQEGSWFNPHRGLQSIAFILIAVSVIIIFINVGGYSKIETWPLKLHPILGLISIILFFLNPFIALCRCSKFDNNRPWFNWIHFIVGILSYIIAMPTIMLGLRLPGAGIQLSMMNSPQWIVIFFIIFQFCIELILEIHGCVVMKKNKNKFYIYEKEMEEYERATTMETKSLKSTPRPVYPRLAGRGFRLFCLVFYILICILVAAVLTIMIIMH